MTGDPPGDTSGRPGGRSPLPPGINPAVPTAARIYDYWLGGHDNFTADRIAALKIAEAAPEVPVIARENRKFPGRAVRYLAAEAGISHFPDLGTGLPTRGNVHKVAQQVNPAARVVYSDNDPMVLAHSRALKTSTGTGITGPVFATFTDAYLAVLSQVISSPQHEIATRGNPAYEILNACFTVRDPLARSPYLAARKANIVFNYAEALWYLSGRDDLAMIGHYAPRLRRFSADGRRLTGTAYGRRLFRPGPDGASQFDRVTALLRADPDTKRAALVVMQPGELADAANPDVACTLALHLMLRGGALHMTAHMRANDAVTGLLCDVFSFTFIQEYAARLLGVRLGTYTHHAGSMHVNTPDLAKARAIVREAASTAPSRFPAAVMPAGHLDGLAVVLEWEQALRLNQRAATPGDPGLAGLHPYWRQIVVLFEAHRQITRHPGEPVDDATLAALDPGHRWLLSHRWPRNAPIAPGSHR